MEERQITTTIAAMPVDYCWTEFVHGGRETIVIAGTTVAETEGVSHHEAADDEKTARYRAVKAVGEALDAAADNFLSEDEDHAAYRGLLIVAANIIKAGAMELA